jgi:ABC-type Fe3+-hydroxamate transport system substrate-binding protein
MRRNIIKISVLILILISMSAFLSGCSKESDEMNEADIQRTEILAGTVEGLTEKSITVKDVFGRTYLFARDDSLIRETL